MSMWGWIALAWIGLQLPLGMLVGQIIKGRK